MKLYITLAILVLVVVLVEGRRGGGPGRHRGRGPPFDRICTPETTCTSGRWKLVPQIDGACPTVGVQTGGRPPRPSPPAAGSRPCDTLTVSHNTTS
jgi:hypothetical protein